MHVPRLILASSSPRRRELLAHAGFTFEVDVSDVDESIHDGEAPEIATARLASEKAEAVARRRGAAAAATNGGNGDEAPSEIILAADTTVVVGERILGKPTDERDAVEMLLSLSGRNHLVLTAWTAWPIGAHALAPEHGISRSTVRMREISRSEAVAYAGSGEPLDKAGAYAAQGEGRRFIGAIEGPLDNVIGLPVAPVAAALARHRILPS